jgi:hypothetical protein
MAPSPLQQFKQEREAFVDWLDDTAAQNAEQNLDLGDDEVLARPQIKRLATAPLDDLVGGIERYTWHVPGALDLSGACRDPKDDKFLACAVEGEAHYLVSGHRYLPEP